MTPSLLLDAAAIARITAICAAVDGLPLAIELAAARARSYRLEDIHAQVLADPGQLRRTGRTGHASDHRATMRSTVEWSHHLLSSEEQLLHRRLAVLPGPFTHAAAAALAPDMSFGDVGDLLADLVHRSMLTSNACRPGASGRTTFGQLATVRAHAAQTLAAAGELASTVARRNAWVCDLVENRPRLGHPAEATWFQSLDEDYATVRATLADLLIERPELRGCRVAPPLAFYWYFRAKAVEAGRWLRLAHDLAENCDITERVATAGALAAALAVQGRIDAARPHIAALLAGLTLVPAERLVEVGEVLVTLAAGIWVHEVHDLVIDVNTALTAIADRAADPQLSLLAESCACMAMIATGHLDEAASSAELIYRRAEAENNETACLIAVAAPLTAALRNQQPALGLPWVGRVLRAHLHLGSATAGMFIEVRGNYETLLGRHRQAVEFYAAAQTQTRRAAMVWPRRALTQQMLAEAQKQLGAAEYEQACKDGESLSLADIAAVS